MKIKDKISIESLYFGVVLPKMSYSSAKEKNELKVYNLFDFSRVKHSVAIWVTMSPEERMKRKDLHDQLMFCFSDVWSRIEFECMMCPWPYKEGDTIAGTGTKTDTFSLYVEPNGELLMDLVNRVTKTSAKAYLRDWRKVHKR